MKYKLTELYLDYELLFVFRTHSETYLILIGFINNKEAIKKKWNLSKDHKYHQCLCIPPLAHLSSLRLYISFNTANNDLAAIRGPVTHG